MTPSPANHRFWRRLAGVSLLANGVLAIALTIELRDRLPIDVNQTAAARSAAAALSPSPPSAAAPRSTWFSFADDDLLALGVRLRDSGFPSSVVREILIARIAERPVLERVEKRIALEKENPQLADELLRPQSYEDDSGLGLMMFRQRYGELSDEKTAQLKRLLQDQSEAERKLVRAIGNLAGHAEYQLLQKKQEENIASLLTPAEFFEYELRSSDTARQMRRLLFNFDTTEAEFRALFPLFRELPPSALSARTATASNLSVAMREQWGKLSDPAFQSRIEQVLGPDRSVDFRRATAQPGNPPVILRNP